MRFRDYCQGSTMTQKDIAEGLGCSKAYVSYLCSGKKSPSFTFMKTVHGFTQGMVTFQDWADHET